MVFLLGEPRHAAGVQGEPGEVDAGADHPLVVVGVDADRVCFQVEAILTIFDLKRNPN